MMVTMKTIMMPMKSEIMINDGDDDDVGDERDDNDVGEVNDVEEIDEDGDNDDDDDDRDDDYMRFLDILNACDCTRDSCIKSTPLC